MGRVSNHTELRERIRVLELSRGEYEERLLKKATKVLSAVENPAPFIKAVTKELAKDKDFRKDLLQVGLSAAVNYLGRLLQSGSGADAISSFLFGKLAGETSSGDRLWSRLIKFFSSAKSSKQEQA